MNAKIFRDAANLLSNNEARTPQGLKIEYSCESISEAQDLPIYNDTTPLHDLFHHWYSPSGVKLEMHQGSAYFGCTTEWNLARQIALDLLAEIIEQGDL